MHWTHIGLGSERVPLHREAVINDIFSQIHVWRVTYHSHESPCLVILVGLISILHGLVGVTEPPDKYNLQVILNGNQLLNNLPLRQFIVASGTTLIGITGLTFMVSVNKLSWVWWGGRKLKIAFI